MGMKTAMVVRVEAVMAKPTSVGTGNGRFARGKSRFAVAVYVLEHDDGVVHQNAHGQGQPAKGYDVEVNVEEIHADEGGHHGDRYRQTDDERIPQIPEEVDEGEDGEH